MVYTSACLSAPAVQRTAFLQRDRRRCLWDSGMLGTHAPAAYSKSGWITDRKNDLRAFSDNWREVRFIAPIFRATLDTLCMVFDQDAIIFFLLSFCFLVCGRRNYISGMLIDTFSICTTRWNNPRNFPAVDFDWMIGASKCQSVLLYCRAILSLLLKKFYALLHQLTTRNLRESLFQPFLAESWNVDK